MATRRYSISIGDNEYSITEAVGAATATKEIELTVDLAVVTDVVGGKQAVVLALEKLLDYLLRGNWPPA